jgi:hypothetical protein
MFVVTRLRRHLKIGTDDDMRYMEWLSRFGRRPVHTGEMMLVGGRLGSACAEEVTTLRRRLKFGEEGDAQCKKNISRCHGMVRVLLIECC